MSVEFLITAVVLLSAGVIAVPIASRFGLGSVLGYLLAGVVIRPILLALGVDVVSIQHFAEFGVVMMLFIIGLELEPKALWAMRHRLLGLGGMQVGLSTLLVSVCMVAFGFEWTIALAVGLTLSLSSTAIVLQTLNEKSLMNTDGGKAGFSVLLFQDIAVIPMLALMPLLARPVLIERYDEASHSGQGSAHAVTDHAASGDHGAAEHGGNSLSLVDGLGPIEASLVTIGAIIVVVLFGLYVVPRLFHYIAKTGLRELFVALALAIVLGIALLMTLVNVSPGLGTFLAGVILANSEFRHELESDINPFRGLLLGIFFISIGATINFEVLAANFAVVIGAALGLMVLKAAVLYACAIVFKLKGADKWLLTLGLAQAGEFGFVLINFTVGQKVIPSGLSEIMLLVVTITMMLTPLLFVLYERVIVPRYLEGQSREADKIEEQGDVILVGHGRIGGVVNRMLRAAGYKVTVLDSSASQLAFLQKFGFRAFYGDASRPDLLEAAGIAKARLLIVTSGDEDQTNRIVSYVCKTYPDVHVIARAVNRTHVYDLYALGCRDIVRDTFDGSVRIGRSAYEALGAHPYTAQKLGEEFKRLDQEALVEMAEAYDPNVPLEENHAYIERVAERVKSDETQLTSDGRAFIKAATRGWQPPTQHDVETVKKTNG